MPIASMTGFGEAAGTAGGLAWRIEIRSVNGRGLDMRFRLPQGADALEPVLRAAVRERLARGSVTVQVSVERERAPASFRVDEKALGDLLDALDTINATLGRRPLDRSDIDPLRLVGIRGLVEAGELSDTLSKEERAAIADDMDVALSVLVRNRETEGEHLKQVVLAQMDAIAGLVAEAEASPARTPEAIRERLARNIARLSDQPGLDEARLHQEAVLLATKADIREEIDRLHAHVDAARGLVSGDGPAGRKLDFLAQEFNREANTLCSKSNDPDVTRIGMELKVIIDQFREQVQNIE